MQIIDNDYRKTQETIEVILKAMQENDKTRLKSLFAKTALTQIQEFEHSAEQLFDYYNGLYESYDEAGTFVETTKDEEQIFQIMESSFSVKTDLCEYRFAMQYVTKGNQDNVGIISLYVIKMEDDVNLDYAYWGDGKFSPGIHIAIRNEI